MFAVRVPLAPMAPMLARPPFHRDGWVYEEKVDGWRMLAYKDGSRVRLISRNAGRRRVQTGAAYEVMTTTGLNYAEG